MLQRYIAAEPTQVEIMANNIAATRVRLDEAHAFLHSWAELWDVVSAETGVTSATLGAIST
jgi:hypothetical protein